MSRIALVLCMILGVFVSSHCHGVISSDEIIRKADEVRNPSKSYFLDIAVTSKGDGNLHRFRVALNGNKQTRIETLEPAKDRGRNMLMLDENMWVFMPKLKRAVRVSLNQKLTGEASNGDISRLRWSGDYAATLESETDSEWVISLVANKKGLTYSRIKVWIRKDNFHPIKGEYLTLAGKVLKNVQYTGYKKLAGKERPSKIIITDAVRSGEESTIHIRKMIVKNFPSTIFKKSELGSQRIK